MQRLLFELYPGADTKTLSARGYALARALCAQHTGHPADALDCRREPHGKPYFVDAPGFHFNLSHSGAALALAVSDTPIGVDVERLRAPDFRIARRNFAPDEAAFVGEDAQRFFQIWTQKEAYLKYTGDGLSRPLASFSVLVLPNLRFETQTRDGYVLTTCKAQ
ncbi:MAG: 4'-phosphopantetheinyl transferase superfamily protein [Oscillospiraceae bacterium]|jgi:4'-phosphopantetheinyl transferase|nr:4'-phosphopantetheinyl transferase superfamily protein [Oscillospiraceae bacterium]